VRQAAAAKPNAMPMGKKNDDGGTEDLSRTMLADRKAAAALAALGLLETVLASTWRHDAGIVVGCACLALSLVRCAISVPCASASVAYTRRAGLRHGHSGGDTVSGDRAAETQPQEEGELVDGYACGGGGLVDGLAPGDAPGNVDVHAGHAAGERAQLVLPKDESVGAGGGGSASCDHRMMRSPRRRWVLSVLSVVLGCFCLALSIVHLVSPDPRIAAFPTLCEAKQGCARIALENPWRAGGLTPLTFDAPAHTVLSAVLQWVDDTNAAGGGERKHVIAIHNREGDGGGPDGIVVHLRAISALWGFADDVVVSIR